MPKKTPAKKSNGAAKRTTTIELEAVPEDDGLPARAGMHSAESLRAEFEAAHAEPKHARTVDDPPEPDEDEPAPESAPPSSEGTDEPAAAAANGKTASLAHALRALRSAHKKLSRHDWDALGVSGIAGAMAIIKTAIDRAVATRAKGTAAAPAGLVVGGRVDVREKFAGKYDGIIDATKGLELVAVNRSLARVRLPSGEKIVIATRHIEAAS